MLISAVRLRCEKNKTSGRKRKRKRRERERERGKLLFDFYFGLFLDKMKRWKKGRRNGQWREGTREEGAWKDSHWMIKGQNISSDSVRPRYGNQNQCTRCGLCFGANIPHRKSRISCAKQPGRPQCPFVLLLGVDPRSSVMPFSPFFPRSEVRFFFVGRFF